MLFIAYSTIFSCFGKWDLMCEYHQCRIGQRGPTLVGHVHGPGSWEDLAYVNNIGVGIRGSSCSTWRITICLPLDKHKYCHPNTM